MNFAFTSLNMTMWRKNRMVNFLCVACPFKKNFKHFFPRGIQNVVPYLGSSEIPT